MPSAPITGGAVKHEVLKYELSFAPIGPAVTNWFFLHFPLSSARFSLMPKTLWAFVSATVRASSD
jgi:hypothetical protein